MKCVATKYTLSPGVSIYDKLSLPRQVQEALSELVEGAK